MLALIRQHSSRDQGMVLAKLNLSSLSQLELQQVQAGACLTFLSANSIICKQNLNLQTNQEAQHRA